MEITHQQNTNYFNILLSYILCRKNKPRSLNKTAFEFFLEQNLDELTNELNQNNYKIGKSVCFIILEPKVREIWAANFRDRIVHHLIYNHIFYKFLHRFIKDTFSCIPKRGTQNAAIKLEKYAKNFTNNYSKDAYYIKCDIKNFFVRIDKDILFEKLKKQVDTPFLLKLLDQVVYNDIKNNVIIKTDKKRFDLLPKHKSLWYTADAKGLPIGNLTSQFFSNIYLNELDWFIKRKLKCKYYCRYVDDFVILGNSPKELLNIYEEIKKFMYENLKLELHTNKRVLNKISKGIDFVGYVIKPHRILLRQKTLKKCFNFMEKYAKNENRFDEKEIEKYITTINSYLGLLRHVSGFKLRKTICLKSINLFITCDKEFTKLISVKRQFIKSHKK